MTVHVGPQKRSQWTIRAQSYEPSVLCFDEHILWSTFPEPRSAAE